VAWCPVEAQGQLYLHPDSLFYRISIQIEIAAIQMLAKETLGGECDNMVFVSYL
jgi:hypothetical protein